MNENGTWWGPVVRFAAHVTVGAAMFAIVASVSVLLSLAVHWLEGVGVPSFTLWVLEMLERAILIIDAVAFLLFLIRTAFDWIVEVSK